MVKNKKPLYYIIIKDSNPIIFNYEKNPYGVDYLTNTLKLNHICSYNYKYIKDLYETLRLFSD